MVFIKAVLLMFSMCVALSVQDKVKRTTINGICSKDKVKVSVYYESLCPDSISFIKKQLYPTYKKLHSIMDVDLIPYGKAIQNKVNGKWEFSCQHGENECLGNKVQSCALNQNYSEETEVAYVNCVMSNRNPAQAGETCANQVDGVSWAKINNCVTSDEGDDLLAANGDRTHGLTPQIAFVPTVIFNDQYDDDLMWESLRDLNGVICKILKYPSVCSSVKN